MAYRKSRNLKLILKGMNIYSSLLNLSKQKNVCKDAFLLCGIEKEKNNEDTVFKQVSKIL